MFENPDAVETKDAAYSQFAKPSIAHPYVIFESEKKEIINIFRVGIFLDFVRRSGTTRAEGPHGARVRKAERKSN